MEKLSQIEISQRLASFNKWTREGEILVKEYTFKDFNDAMNFVNKSATIAEALNHHPDILIHGWNKVKLMISTHSAGGITPLDFELIAKLEEIL